MSRPQRDHGRWRAPALALALALALLGCATPEAATPSGGAPALRVDAARASVPVAGVSQLVLALSNEGDGDDRLVGADTDVALAVEVHRTEIDAEGRALMRLLDVVELPAGTQVRFRPGELHLMLIVPDERVVAGATFDLTLRFDRSPPLVTTVRVVPLLDLLEDDATGTG